jgi:asparagine synthase (glutamine-hydrolysing)
MSGIAVIHNLDGQPAQPALLIRMLDAIAHRAVDGRGSWIHSATAMGHARMSTTPEAMHERQPLVVGARENALCLVLDGRVDNRNELRKALTNAGTEPHEDTDAELILRAWQCWREQSPGKIIGDFAYVVWDGSRRTLFCARDTCGIRPFFYFHNAYSLLCASELHQLLVCPHIPREPNPPAIAEYMCATLSAPEETLFRHIRRLPPAHYLIADRRGVTVRRYYDLDPTRSIRYGTDEQYAEHFLEVFKEAVRCRLRASSPVAAELSGGLDSSSVVATVKTLQHPGRSRSAPLECFSIVYDQPDCDERQYADEVALANGFICNFVSPTLLDYSKCREQVRRFSDLPDYVNGAVFDGMRDELVRRGFRVVLTGVGGDQWLQGSDQYLCDLITRFQWCELWRRLACDPRFTALASPSDKFIGLLRWGLKPMLPNAWVRLLRWLLRRPGYHSAIESAFARNAALSARLEREPRRPRAMSHAQRTIYDTWASPWMVHVLEMDERGNAAAGVEGRHPFYDRRVVEFAFAIPEDQRARFDLTKVVLRNAMKGLLPQSVRERRDKGRFGRVFIETFNRIGGEFCFDSMAMESKGWVNAERMRQLCRERLATYPCDLWPLWTTFAVDLWFGEVCANSTTPTCSSRAATESAITAKLPPLQSVRFSGIVEQKP